MSEASKAPMIPVLKRRLRALSYLAAVTGVAVALAGIAQWQRASTGAPAFETARMFPSLKANIENVATIQIETKASAFNITRDAAGRWTVPDKASYPADFDTVKKTIIGLAELNLVEQRTARADWHEKLGVSLPKSGGTGTLVTMKDAKGGVLASLIVGTSAEGASAGSAQAVYARRADQPQTYVARGNFAPPTEKNQWLNKAFIELVRDRMKSAALRPFKGRPYTVAREKAKDENFRLIDAIIPHGRELRTPGEPNGIGYALLGVSFDDVKPAKDLDFRNAARATFTTFDGLTLNLSLIEIEREYWLTAEAVAAAESPASPSPSDATKLKPDVAKEAKELNGRLAGWAYKIPRYKGTLLVTPLEDLFKPLGSP